jgi:hypothetical protein
MKVKRHPSIPGEAVTAAALDAARRELHSERAPYRNATA